MTAPVAPPDLDDARAEDPLHGPAADVEVDGSENADGTTKTATSPSSTATPARGARGVGAGSGCEPRDRLETFLREQAPTLRDPEVRAMLDRYSDESAVLRARYSLTLLVFFSGYLWLFTDATANLLALLAAGAAAAWGTRRVTPFHWGPVAKAMDDVAPLVMVGFAVSGLFFAGPATEMSLWVRVPAQVFLVAYAVMCLWKVRRGGGLPRVEDSDSAETPPPTAGEDESAAGPDQG